MPNPNQTQFTQRNEAADPLGDYRFQDPEWMAWWLDSLFLLNPQEQIYIAERLLQVVYARESREIVEQFIAHQDPAKEAYLAEPSYADERSQPIVDEPELYADQPLMIRVARISWDRYKLLICGAGCILLIYVMLGIRAILRMMPL